jgi:hypothetical protein
VRIHSHRQPLPAFLASSFEHGLATAGFHSCTETVLSYPPADFWLIGSLRHTSYQFFKFSMIFRRIIPYRLETVNLKRFHLERGDVSYGHALGCFQFIILAMFCSMTEDSMKPLDIIKLIQLECRLKDHLCLPGDESLSLKLKDLPETSKLPGRSE